MVDKNWWEDRHFFLIRNKNDKNFNQWICDDNIWIKIIDLFKICAKNIKEKEHQINAVVNCNYFNI